MPDRIAQPETKLEHSVNVKQVIHARSIYHGCEQERDAESTPQQEIFKFHSFYIHFVDCLAIPPVTKLFFKHPYKPDLYLTPEKANTPLNLGTPTTPARDENKA